MKLNEFDFEVDIQCPRYPTEDKEKLIQCLSNVFPKTKWDIEEKRIEGKTKYLTRFKRILEDMRIRDTARSYLKERMVGDRCSFSLSKQATCSEKINFSETEKSLGEVKVIIRCEKISGLIENITGTEEL
ncbi:MAG: RNA-binding domain-containing protein [Thermoplasmata archaeon]